MKYLFLALTSIILYSCNDADTINTESPLDTKKKETISGSPEDIMLQTIKASLKVKATDQLKYKIYKEHLDLDEKIDWVVKVNLYGRALEEAIASGQVAKFAEMGNMGNYNALFYMDGRSGIISSPIMIPSSANAPLEISFENITSNIYKDFTVDLRIRNSRRRRFYTVYNAKPFQTCEAVIYDGLGTAESVASVIKYEVNGNIEAKNILVYDGILEQVDIQNPDDIYTINPVITETDQLSKRWYYNPKSKKYFLIKDEL